MRLAPAHHSLHSSSKRWRLAPPSWPVQCLRPAMQWPNCRTQARPLLLIPFNTAPASAALLSPRRNALMPPNISGYVALDADLKSFGGPRVTEAAALQRSRALGSTLLPYLLTPPYVLLRSCCSGQPDCHRRQEQHRQGAPAAGACASPTPCTEPAEQQLRQAPLTLLPCCHPLRSCITASKSTCEREDSPLQPPLLCVLLWICLSSRNGTCDKQNPAVDLG